MAPHPREFSEDSTASHDTALSLDARVARAFEDALSMETKKLAVADTEENEHDSDNQPEEQSASLSATTSQYTSSKAISSEESVSWEVLRRTLSVHSVVSTSSSFAERTEKAKVMEGATFSVIGRGSCGTIFEVPGTETAMKKGSNKEGLWTDANLTNVACTAVFATRSRLEMAFSDICIPRVPKVHGWINESDLDKWWQQNQKRFPGNDDQTGFVFHVQRILPLPKPSREALIKTYFPPNIQEMALSDPENRPCLVRPYLGLRRGDREFEHPAETLQNFPLHLDQMEDIGLDIVHYSKEMAIGLAIMHWEAGLDTMDMEFMIGSAATHSELSPIPIVENFKEVPPFSIPAGDFKRRKTHLWMLDFDKAEKLKFSDWKAARAQMVTAVTANDPYFPNPATTGLTENAAWSEFEKIYLKAAEFLISTHPTLGKRSKTMKYPGEFLNAWKKRAQGLEQTKDGAFIEFGE